VNVGKFFVIYRSLKNAEWNICLGILLGMKENAAAVPKLYLSVHLAALAMDHSN
jgi:hypothetical protein